MSFGILPATILHVLLIKSHQAWVYKLHFTGIPIVSLLAFIFVIAAALRLAKFNTDEDQKNVFTGLPTPAAALFVASLPLIMRFDLYVLNYETFYLEKIMLNPWVLLLVTFGLSWMMLSDMKLMSLKFKSLSFKENMPQYLLIIIAIILFVFLLFLAIPLILIIYILFSYIFNSKSSIINGIDVNSMHGRKRQQCLTFTRHVTRGLANLLGGGRFGSHSRTPKLRHEPQKEVGIWSLDLSFLGVWGV